MTDKPRTFKIQTPLMAGEDIKSWKGLLRDTALEWGVHLPLSDNDVYDMSTRSLSKTMAFALGFTHRQFDNGITPWLRERVRNPTLRSETQKGIIVIRRPFRDALRKKYPKGKAEDDVAAPLAKILTMTWGWHPGIHDGIDLICGANAPIHALCDAEVIDVRSGGWWGLGAPSNPAIREKGDGIIQIKCLTNEGPFRQGLHFGYGHAEKASVHVGQKVEAGDLLGHAGLANAWHVHFMVNDGHFGLQGRGSEDPLPFVKYALSH